MAGMVNNAEFSYDLISIDERLSMLREHERCWTNSIRRGMQRSPCPQILLTQAMPVAERCTSKSRIPRRMLLDYSELNCLQRRRRILNDLLVCLSTSSTQ